MCGIEADRHAEDRKGGRPDSPAQESSVREDPDDYGRHLAAEIIAMLPYARSDADRVLRFVHEMLNVTLQPEEQPSELHQN
jgi:hypothetical protein